jgi:hypothetical protein
MKARVKHSDRRQALCLFVRDEGSHYEKRREDILIQAMSLDGIKGKIVELTGYLSFEDAQKLVDDLWKAGIRPTEIGTADT